MVVNFLMESKSMGAGALVENCGCDAIM